MDCLYQILSKAFHLPDDPSEFQECCREIQLSLNHVDDQFASLLVFSMGYSITPSELLYKLISNSPFCETRGQRYLSYSIMQAIIELLPNDPALFAQGIYDLITCYDPQYAYNLNHMKQFLLNTLLPTYSSLCKNYPQFSFVSIDQNHFDFEKQHQLNQQFPFESEDASFKKIEINNHPKSNYRYQVEGFYDDLESLSKDQKNFEKINQNSPCIDNEIKNHAKNQSFEFSSSFDIHQISQDYDDYSNQSIVNILPPLFENQDQRQSFKLPSSPPITDLQQQSQIQFLDQITLGKSQQEFQDISYQLSPQPIQQPSMITQLDCNQQCQPFYDSTPQYKYQVQGFFDDLQTLLLQKQPPSVTNQLSQPHFQDQNFLDCDFLHLSSDVKASPDQLLSTHPTSSLNTTIHQPPQDDANISNDLTQLNLPALDTNSILSQHLTSQQSLQSFHPDQKESKSLSLQFKCNQDDNKQFLHSSQDISFQLQKNYFSILNENSTISQFQHQFRFSQSNIENLTLVQLMESSISTKDFDTSLNILYSVIYTYLLQNKYLEHPLTYLEVLTKIPILDLTAFFNLAFTNQDIHQLKLRYGFIQLSEIISNYLPLQHLFDKFFSKYIEKLQQYPLRVAYYHLMNMQDTQQIPQLPDLQILPHREKISPQLISNQYSEFRKTKDIYYPEKTFNYNDEVKSPKPPPSMNNTLLTLPPNLDFISPPDNPTSQYQTNNKLEVPSNQYPRLTIQVH